MKIFEKKHPTRDEEDTEEEEIEFIVIGSGRLGNNLVRNILDKKKKVLVVDFDPDVVTKWQNEGVKAEYGDADDPELPALLPIKNTKQIISTATNLDTNVRLLKFLQQNNYEGKITVVAHSDEEEETLKEEGAHSTLRPFKDAAEVIIKKLSHAK